MFRELLEKIIGEGLGNLMVFNSKDLGVHISGELYGPSDVKRNISKFYNELIKLLKRCPQERLVRGSIEELTKASSKGEFDPEDVELVHSAMAAMQDYTESSLAWVWDVHGDGSIKLVHESEVEDYI